MALKTNRVGRAKARRRAAKDKLADPAGQARWCPWKRYRIFLACCGKYQAGTERRHCQRLGCEELDSIRSVDSYQAAIKQTTNTDGGQRHDDSI